MIEFARLSFSDDFPPALLEWDKEKEDFTVKIPDGITREELVSLAEEVKRLTAWAENK